MQKVTGNNPNLGIVNINERRSEKRVLKAFQQLLHF